MLGWAGELKQVDPPEVGQPERSVEVGRSKWQEKHGPYRQVRRATLIRQVKQAGSDDPKRQPMLVGYEKQGELD